MSVWNFNNVAAIFNLPIPKLILKAQTLHAQFFNNDEIELCTLLSVKTGTCPEDCSYCPQSGHYKTDTEAENILDITKVIEQAKQAKASGATRFCMGAAWRSPPKKDFPKVLAMVQAVKELGLEACATLGMLDADQAKQLHAAGLDFYNHNLDSSPEFYKKIITTRTYEDRLETLEHVRQAGIHVCCGGIIGMGETRDDRINFLVELGKLPTPPKSIPINRLMPVIGTPLEKAGEIDNIEFVRTIATSRIMFPEAIIRLSAGRMFMSDEMQTLCFLAGANSIWLGDKLLVLKNSDKDKDEALFKKLGLTTKSQLTA